MEPKNPNQPKVLLSTDDVARWQHEWLTIDDRIRDAELHISELRKLKTELLRRLEGVSLFVPEVSSWLKEQQELLRQKEEREAPDDVALTEAIVRVLTARGPARPVTRERLRAYLPNFGYSTTKIQANPNYLYIALKRLVDRGIIVEGPTGYRIK